MTTADLLAMRPYLKGCVYRTLRRAGVLDRLGDECQSIADLGLMEAWRLRDARYSPGQFRRFAAIRACGRAHNEVRKLVLPSIGHSAVQATQEASSDARTVVALLDADEREVVAGVVAGQAFAELSRRRGHTRSWAWRRMVSAREKAQEALSA